MGFWDFKIIGEALPANSRQWPREGNHVTFTGFIGTSKHKARQSAKFRVECLGALNLSRKISSTSIQVRAYTAKAALSEPQRCNSTSTKRNQARESSCFDVDAHHPSPFAFGMLKHVRLD